MPFANALWLLKILAPDFHSAFDRVSLWPEKPDGVSHWRKAEFLSGLFHARSRVLVDGLALIITKHGAPTFDLACEILRRFEGLPTIDPALQAMIASSPPDDDHYSSIASVFDSTGVVSGEFGFAEAYEAKFARLESWLTHPNARVVQFAQKHRQYLDQRIRDERRRATERKQRRQLDFEDGNNED